jgi:bifunctional non-homologous end joining protein LigD
MGLERYNEKRDFSKTKEPKGVLDKSAGKLRFVVQKHAASRLHYDFRLEIDGVLVSWAVPKGPSANPAEKRLAVQTEDHPMGYIDFEGTIPKGQYGGGTVMVWDIGTFHAEGNTDAKKDNSLLRKQLRQGNIKVILEGTKLKGSWHCVKMSGEEGHWLLMKGNDAHAGKKTEYDQNSVLTNRTLEEIAQGSEVWNSNRAAANEAGSGKKAKADKVNKTAKSKTGDQPEPAFTAQLLQGAKKMTGFPGEWRPQLATLADQAFDHDDWLFETKYDGYRALAFIRDQKAELVSRNGIRFDKYPEVTRALEGLPDDVILDGEVVVEDEKGKSNFQWLQNRNEDLSRGHLKFYVFDILYFNGFDLTQLTLSTRKKILQAALPSSQIVHYSEHVVGTGVSAFQAVEKSGGEGIIAKKIASRYQVNKRSKDWLKIKTEMQQEVVIAGYTEPQGGRVGIGALLCGVYKGKELEYAGKVGTGFTEATLKELKVKLEKIEQKESPFKNAPKVAGAHWVKPKLLAQVKFTEWTSSGNMRHPVYLGLRQDKPAKKVVKEMPEVSVAAIKKEKTPTKNTSKKSKPETTAYDDVFALSDKVEFSNLDKLFFPAQKITKGDVIRYYAAIADTILPYLKDRPQSLRRTPDGLKNQGFFQKNVAGAVPKWVKTKKIQSESASEPIEWLLCQDKDTLLFLANWGCIELNPWSSRVRTLDSPDYIIFDLDPHKADSIKLVNTALKVKEVLDKLCITGYIKTSGGKGLHVFIPVMPKYTYEQTRDFSLLVSQMVHRELPDITSLERMPKKREGKIYLDFLQNGRGKTMASVYSVRPREGAGVSTPLAWEEITPNLDLQDYNMLTMPKRLAEKGDLWADFFSNPLDLKKLLKGL